MIAAAVFLVVMQPADPLMPSLYSGAARVPVLLNTNGGWSAYSLSADKPNLPSFTLEGMSLQRPTATYMSACANA